MNLKNIFILDWCIWIPLITKPIFWDSSLRSQFPSTYRYLEFNINCVKKILNLTWFILVIHVWATSVCVCVSAWYKCKLTTKFSWLPIAYIIDWDRHVSEGKDLQKEKFLRKFICTVIASDNCFLWFVRIQVIGKMKCPLISDVTLVVIIAIFHANDFSLDNHIVNPIAPSCLPACLVCVALMILCVTWKLLHRMD